VLTQETTLMSYLQSLRRRWSLQVWRSIERDHVTIGGEREATAVKDIADIDGGPTVGTEGSVGNKNWKTITHHHLHSADRTNLDIIHVMLPLDELIECLDRNFFQPMW
jgi:hypothetical protein